MNKNMNGLLNIYLVSFIAISSYPANIYLFKVVLETLEKGVKYAQS